MTSTQTHVRRRSRVSIHILPETREGDQEDDEFDEKRGSTEGSETDATDETHLLSARRNSFALPVGLAVGAGGRQEGNAQRTLWRAISVLAAVAAASCLTTAALLLLCRSPATDIVAEAVKG